MIASNLLPRTSQRFAWVLWLALLVPMAQLAAVLHMQSHWARGDATTLDHKATPADACGQCVAVASLVAGGAVSAAAFAAATAAPASLAQWAITQALSNETFAGYRSRAPPAASRRSH